MSQPDTPLSTPDLSARGRDEPGAAAPAAPAFPLAGDGAPPPLGGAPSFFAEYFLFLVRNLVGWIFLAAAAVLGPLPGPGGILLFFIGFGLISFPGKRKLMARVFRGRRFRVRSRATQVTVVLASPAVAAGALWWACWRHSAWFPWHPPAPTVRWLGILGASAVAWVVLQALLRLANWLVKIMPRVRHKVRPWLRHRGIDLLPPRLRKRVHLADGTFAFRRAEGDVVRFHPRHTDRLKLVWKRSKPWLRRAVGTAVTVLIFAWMLKPVVSHWPEVAPRVHEIHFGPLALSGAMFAAFLFLFRALAWRTILAGFGHRLPVPPATRIWSTSELARYLPGVIWQVVGRVYLVRPYGVGGTVCSASQVLELVVFLLANVLVALACLLWYATKLDPHAGRYLYAALALVPLLMLLLHPRVFYTALSKVMTWRNKRLPARRVRGKTLALLTAWACLGLLWQSLAIWLIVAGPLRLPPEKWWVVAGAYCLAWAAGFVAFWAPGGLGVREWMFVTAMMFALPEPVRQQFGDPHVLFGFLVFLGIVLRLWTIAGELLLATVAHLVDYRGALGRPDAPGRLPEPADA